MGSKDNEGIGIPSCNLPNEKDEADGQAAQRVVRRLHPLVGPL
jgi:hypothetical protein